MVRQTSNMAEVDFQSGRKQKVPNANLNDSSRRPQRNIVRQPQIVAPPVPERFDTVYPDPYDRSMARCQMKIATLTGPALEKQEAWAQSKVKLQGNACPGGYKYLRYLWQPYEGYVCANGDHLITDRHLASGKRGMFVVDHRFGRPHYLVYKIPEDPEFNGIFHEWPLDRIWTGPVFPASERDGFKQWSREPGGEPGAWLGYDHDQ